MKSKLNSARLSLLALITGLHVVPAEPTAAQTFTFGSEFQTTPSANITYNSGTGVFQYANPDSVEDFAGVPLTGNAANLITNSSGWTASISINIAARTMGGVSDQAPFVYFGLGVYSGNLSSNRFIIECGQVNNTAGDDSDDVPNGFYGTIVRSSALTNGNYDTVIPLGNSQHPIGSVGDIYLSISGTTGPANTPVSESFSAVAGVLTLSYNAATKTLFGFYNGTAVCNYAPTSWGANPPLTLAVFGASEQGAIVSTNTDMGSNFYAGPLPALAITHTGANVILTWPTNVTGFTLQSTTNPVSTNWNNVSPVPVVVNTNNVVTNAVSSASMFYRLSQ